MSEISSYLSSRDFLYDMASLSSIIGLAITFWLLVIIKKKFLTKVMLPDAIQKLKIIVQVFKPSETTNSDTMLESIGQCKSILKNIGITMNKNVKQEIDEVLGLLDKDMDNKSSDSIYKLLHQIIESLDFQNTQLKLGA